VDQPQASTSAEQQDTTTIELPQHNINAYITSGGVTGSKKKKKKHSKDQG
jgi:hypothetical protein